MENEVLKKILYVDDEDINLRLFQLAFKKKFDVVVAKSGEEGLQMINEINNIQLIISDMKMPNMDGIEFLTRAQEVVANIPRVILSGYEMSDKIEQAIDSGIIAGYFTKPLNKMKLEQFILEI